jgi:flagellar protein FliO/FliZ
MESVSLLRIFFALTSVLALIGLLALAAKQFGLADLAAGVKPKSNGPKKRLAVTEALALDQKRRLLLIRRDDTEHLVLLTQDGATLVESGVTPDGGGKDETKAAAATPDIINFRPPSRILRLIKDRS